MLPLGTPERYVRNPNLLILDLRGSGEVEGELTQELGEALYQVPLPVPKVTFRYPYAADLVVCLKTIGDVVAYDFPVSDAPEGAPSKVKRRKEASKPRLTEKDLDLSSRRRWATVRGWPLPRKPFSNPGPDQVNKGLFITFV